MFEVVQEENGIFGRSDVMELVSMGCYDKLCLTAMFKDSLVKIENENYMVGTLNQCRVKMKKSIYVVLNHTWNCLLSRRLSGQQIDDIMFGSVCKVCLKFKTRFSHVIASSSAAAW